MILRKGFTYIEVLITLAIMAVLFIPMMQLFSRALYSATVSGDLITAVNLARWEMERIKNLNINKYQLANQGNVWIPELEQPPFEINKQKWRIQRHIIQKSGDPLEVTVRVFTADNFKKPVASLATLIEDTVWVEVDNGKNSK